MSVVNKTHVLLKIVSFLTIWPNWKFQDRIYFLSTLYEIIEQNNFEYTS